MKKTNQKAMAPSLDAREKQIDSDYEWCLRDPEIRQTYGGKVVVVHRRRIWGVGQNHGAALAAARRKPGCPSRDRVAIVAVPEYDSGLNCP